MTTIPLTTTQASPHTIAIIGGGLGGVVLAIGLLRRNIPIHIYQSAAAFAEIGAGVTIGPNAIRALALNSPDLLEAFNKHVTHNASTHSSFLTFRRGIPLDPSDPDKDNLLFDLTNDESAPHWKTAPARSAVHRAKFLEEMVRFIPEGSVSFKKALVRIEELPSSEVTTSDSGFSSGSHPSGDGHEAAVEGGVKLHFSDNTSAIHLAAIGCDGVRSATRAYVHGPSATPTYSSSYAYRALIPSHIMISTLGFDRAMNGQCHIGPGGTITTYPVDKGAYVNLVAIRTRPGSEWKRESWVVDATEEDFLSDFEGWDGRLVGLMREWRVGGKWALWHYLHDKPYYKERVCLAGDAAHAMTANLGAGAGQAMEDGVVLAELLGMGMGKGLGVERVFEAYDKVRRERSQEVVRLSWLCGETYAHQEEGVKEDYGKMRERLVERVRWVLEGDLEGDLERGMGMLS